jgi:AP-1 complex subunit mu
VRVTFEIPYNTASGLQVKYLKVVEKDGYSALPWVRYITRSNGYEFRFRK